MSKNPVVTIEMQNGDKITAELYPEVAPNTVNNFIELIKSGFYDGLIFHRVIPGFNQPLEQSFTLCSFTRSFRPFQGNQFSYTAIVQKLTLQYS